MDNSKTNNRFYKISILIISLFTFLILLLFNSNNDAFAKKDQTDPSMWPTWHQYDSVWGDKWGRPINSGCYVTSIAIQAARSGVKKAQNGKSMNPLNVFNGSEGGMQDTGVGFKMKVIYPKGTNVGTYMTAKAMGSSNAVKAIKAIEKAGYYPIIHMDGPSGLQTGDTHYMSSRKMEGNNITLYDPARQKGKDYISWEGGQEAFKKKIAWVEGWTGGPTKFQDAKSPLPDDGSGKTFGKDSGGDEDSDGDSTPARIKPIFNPFVTRTAVNTDIGYNTDGKTSAFDRNQVLAFAEGKSDMLLNWISFVAMAFLFIYIGFSIVSFLIFLLDSQLDGLISDRLSNVNNNFIRNLFFRGGNSFLGFEGQGNGSQYVLSGWKSQLILILFTSFFTLLIATRTLSLLLGQFFFTISKLF